MKNNPNASFVTGIESEAIRKRIDERAARINAALSVLRDHDEPATLEALRTYQQRGFDHLREDAVAECRSYIQATKMPSYLQQDALQRAYKSVDAAFLERMKDVLIGMELPEDLNVLERDSEDGQYHFASAYIAAEIEQRRYTLTDDEQADFAKFREALRLLSEVEAGKARFATFDAVRDYHLCGSDADDRVAAALKASQRSLKAI